SFESGEFSGRKRQARPGGQDLRNASGDYLLKKQATDQNFITSSVQAFINAAETTVLGIAAHWPCGRECRPCSDRHGMRGDSAVMLSSGVLASRRPNALPQTFAFLR